MGVGIGIDAHKATVFVGAVDELGRACSAQEFANDRRGHAAVAAWIKDQDPARVVGIEGSGSYGAALCRVLLAAGEDVNEVPAFLTHRERRKAPARGKSDAVDALAIARVVGRGEGLAGPREAGFHEDFKLLSDRRDQLVRTRTATINQIHADMVVLLPGYQTKVANLKSRRNLARVVELLLGDGSVRAELVRDRVDELAKLNHQIAAVTKRLAAKVVESGTTLTSLEGVGFVVAAKILGETGDPRRLRSQASFAMLNGTAPVEASSGATKRHRLNRGGNRQINFALHIIATARRRKHPETRAYLSRRLAEGKTMKEAMRCLKRHLSNVLYRQIMADVESAQACELTT